MADMDGFKEAKAYGLKKPQKNQLFFLKGNENRDWGVKNRLARKGARAGILINQLAADKNAVVWIPAKLDAIALELRYLAFQIRALKNAKKATEEA